MLSSVYMIAQRVELDTATGAEWSTVGTALDHFNNLMWSMSRGLDAFNTAFVAFADVIDSENAAILLLISASLEVENFRLTGPVNAAKLVLEETYRYQIAFRQPLKFYLDLKKINEASVTYFQKMEHILFESLLTLKLSPPPEGDETNDGIVTARIQKAAKFLLVVAQAKDFILMQDNVNLTLENVFDSMPDSIKKENMLTHTDAATDYKVLYTLTGSELEDWSQHALDSRKRVIKKKKNQARTATVRAKKKYGQPPIDAAKPVLVGDHETTFQANVDALVGDETKLAYSMFVKQQVEAGTMVPDDVFNNAWREYKESATMIDNSVILLSEYNEFKTKSTRDKLQEQLDSLQASVD